MNPSAILLKTSSGMEAYKSRAASDIPTRTRAILMLVDDKSTAADIIGRTALFPDVQEHLHWLQQHGYITVNEPGSADAARSAAAPPKLLNAALRQMMENELIEFLGPMATLECEDVWPHCPNAAEAVRLLAAKLDAPQAQQFTQRVLKQMEP